MYRRIERHDVASRIDVVRAFAAPPESKSLDEVTCWEPKCVALVHRAIDPTGLAKILERRGEHRRWAAMIRARPAMVPVASLVQVACDRRPYVLAQKHPVNLRRIRHPTPPEVHRFSPSHESIRIFGSDQISGAD